MEDINGNPIEPPGFFRRVIGGGFANAAGTVSPMQAYQLGMPQASGLNMQQLQMLANQPMQQANLQGQKLNNQIMQQQLGSGIRAKFLSAEQAAYAMDPTADRDALKKRAAILKGLFPQEIPEQVVNHLVTANTARIKIGEQEDQFNQKEYDKILKDNDPYSATSRTAVGIVGRATLSANRALKTLRNPMVTAQEAGNVMADIAGIYQNGSPTQFGMSHQEYSTLYGKFKSSLQQITGKPTDALPAAIKNRLIQTLEDMKKTNKFSMNKALKMTEAGKSKVLKNKSINPQWEGFKQQMQGLDEDESGQAATPTNTIQEGNNVTPSGIKYSVNP